MAAIKLSKFLGSAPKISPELLPDAAAQIASNAKVYSGDLIPYHQPSVVDNVSRNGVIRSIYPMRNPNDSTDLKWLSWLTDVDVAVTTALTEEEQRIDNLHKERTKLAMPYYQFWSEFEKTLHFGTQSDGDFNNFMARIEKAKATYDLENEKLRKAKEEAEENLRLIEETNKRIEKERQEMLDKRGKELQPYIVFIRDYNALINSNEDNYQHQFKDIKKGAQDHWEFERKEQLRKQQMELILLLIGEPVDPKTLVFDGKKFKAAKVK